MQSSSEHSSTESPPIGLSLAAYLSWPLAKALKFIADAGYSSVELCIEHPELDPNKLSSGDISKISKILSDNHLRVSSISCRDKEGDFQEALRKCLKGLELARQWGARVFVAGTPPEETDPRRDRTYTALRELLRVAHDKGVTVAVETSPDSVIHGIYNFSMLASRMTELPLGLSFNLVHIALTEGDITEVIDEWAPFIVNANISDCRRDEHVHFLPGEGQLDICGAIHALYRNRYQGDLVIDLPEGSAPDKSAKKALELCRGMLSNVQ